MIKEFIGQGESLEEATQKAIEGLDAKADEEVQIEVLSEYKKKVLGMFGGTTAKVRAYVELPDPKPRKAKEKKEKPQKKVEKAAKVEEIKSDAPDNLVDASTLDPKSSAGKAVAYLNKVLLNLGCENLVIKVAETENGAYISLEGDKLGVVIGRRGETLDAIQYLTSLAANTGNGYYKVTLNIGNYREKREQTLKKLAKKVSEQVLKTGRSRSLEPMKPYERRIIHTAVQNIDGVVSNSTGDGASRRVVISTQGGEKRKANKTEATVEAPVQREPKKDSVDVPLYGRLN